MVDLVFIDFLLYSIYHDTWISGNVTLFYKILIRQDTSTLYNMADLRLKLK